MIRMNLEPAIMFQIFISQMFNNYFKKYRSPNTMFINLTLILKIRHDTNLNGVKELVDQLLLNAVVTILIADTKDSSWTLLGTTNRKRRTQLQLQHVKSDSYSALILEVSHSEYKSYDPAFGNETVSANYYLH